MNRNICIKTFLFLIISFLTHHVAHTQSLEGTRILLEKTAKEKSKSIEYAKRLENSTKPELKGYAAMFYFLYADDLINPFSKLKYFKKGKNILNYAINNNPGIIELRLLRFAVQKELPGILNYDNMNEDREILLKWLNSHKNKDEYLQTKISEILKDE